MTSNLDLERMGALQQWKLRTMKQLEEQAAHCALLAPSKREAYKRSIGVNRFNLGCRLPGIDTHGAVIDLVHCEMEGNLPRHYLGMCMVFKKRGWIKGPDDINEAHRSHPYPPGVSIQPIFDSQLTASAAGLAKTDTSYVGMTAHDMMVFAVHSIAVLERFVPEEERECDVWRCWCTGG